MWCATKRNENTAGSTECWCQVEESKERAKLSDEAEHKHK